LFADADEHNCWRRSQGFPNRVPGAVVPMALYESLIDHSLFLYRDIQFAHRHCYKRIIIDLLNDAYQEAAHQGAAGIYDLKPI
jgi:hypothetical protein